MLRLKVYGLSTISEQNAVIIALVPEDDDSGEEILSIWVTPQTAQLVLMALHDEISERPMMVDLFLKSLEELHALIVRCEIYGLVDQIYYARLVVRCEDGSDFSLEARPSDVIILALRTKVPLEIDDELFHAKKFTSEERRDSLEDEMASFRKFLDQVNPEDFREGT